MDRAAFLRCSLAAVGSTCFFGELPALGSASPPAGTPCEKRADQAQAVIRRLMARLDHELDPEIVTRIMRDCGRECARGAYGERDDKLWAEGDINLFCRRVNERLGEEAARREGDVVHFRYVRNPAGLRVDEGWCLCPVVERGPEGLSESWCACSEGYVAEMFERVVGHPVEVAVTESVKRGGRACRFVVKLPSTT